MSQYKVGIIIVDEQASFAHRHLAAATESLKALGCAEQNILVRHAPKVFNITLTVQFLAEYTDVDAVIILAEEDNTASYQAMLYGITKLQIAWNMPITIGDFTAAAEAIDMVALQNKMEAEAPENIAPDRKSIN
ncbi:MAG: 6,7-dimethyl-8-ribityllumazine synthase [Alistipes sp.]|jgi:6,7-dimethyl-8-ribityllumazine synthase|nr:6,7-dimethyl-8-ribityllumazine synthase [Alistipes sp.]MBO7194597.1 6,7-dimethyl-8-ribityllumazine synthase [Alistipes sp.]